MHRKEVGTIQKTIPRHNTDEQAVRFVETADLSEYDLSEFEPVTFKFPSKTSQLTSWSRPLADQTSRIRLGTHNLKVYS